METRNKSLCKSTSVKPDLKEIETENKNLTILEKEREKVTDENVLLDGDVFKQIFDKNTFIEFKGYKAWKETTCDYVKKAGQKKFEILEKQVNHGLERNLKESIKNA